VHLAMRVARDLGIRPASATAIIQGFGNVGAVSAHELALRNVRVIGVSDHTAAYHDPRGLDVAALEEHVRLHRTLAGFSTEALSDPAELLAQKCDILIPAAMERVIDAPMARRLQCRILAEAANGPTTPDADAILDDRRDVAIIPDILCNSGGVIVSYFEWVQDLQQLFWEEDEVNRRLESILNRAFNQVDARARQDRLSHRMAALAIGVGKVRDAKQTRGLFP